MKKSLFFLLTYLNSNWVHMRVYHLLKALKMIDEHFFITSRTHVSKEIMLSVVHIKIKSVISIFVL